MEYRGDSLADMGSMLTKFCVPRMVQPRMNASLGINEGSSFPVLEKHLRAKYCGAVKERVGANVVDLRKLQTWFPTLQICSSQPCR